MKKLLKVLERFSSVRAVVWGDYLLDRYIYAFAERLSREAPIPILKYEGEREDLGGAGNTAKNAAALGARVEAAGFCGRDERGKRLRQLLEKWGIGTRALLEVEGTTPEKSRFLAGAERTRKQQVMRLDSGGELSPDWEEFKNRLMEVAEDSDVVIISDYGYGSCNGKIYREVRLNQKKPLVLVDSHNHLLDFPEADAATPNIPEIEGAFGKRMQEIEEFARAGRWFLKKTGMKAVFITLGNRGMLLVEKRKRPFYLPVFGSTDIVDVTGAGDTVIAVAALALAAGASFRQAAVLANIAGGTVVMKEGAATVSVEELEEGLRNWWRIHKLTGL